MLKILFVTSEVHPLIKTGGLADVAASLPRALVKLKQDVRILVPGYASVMEQVAESDRTLVGSGELDQQGYRLWQTHLPGTKVKVLLVETAGFSDRPGNPYGGPDGHDWPDNALRFHRFCRVAEALALNQLGLKWQPDVVHCNDWQTALVPALLASVNEKPATVFTIHNLAYRGLFSWQTFSDLQLPPHWWHYESLEFYNQLAFIKGGLVYADAITTVSPSYAEEIQTAAFGWGLEGLLKHRHQQLHGILNGIDTDEWHPGRDAHLPHTYHSRSLGYKQKNKLALQEEVELTVDARTPLLGFIGRLVDQKGVDLLLQALPSLLSEDACQFVLLGSGMAHYQQAFEQLARQFPGKLAVRIGYNEGLAHRMEAGIDSFVMPSAFEPCGLNQLYSLRYGTPPIVHNVGGLKDSVIGWSPMTRDIATGFVFERHTISGLDEAIRHMLQVYQDKPAWQAMQRRAMSTDFSWKRSAQAYLSLYESLSG